MTRKLLGIVGHKNLVRDAHSQGVLNVDNDTLNKYKEERDEKLRLVRMLKEHEELKSDVKEIKSALQLILERIK